MNIELAVAPAGGDTGDLFSQGDPACTRRWAVAG
jgi:hypothetical protein